MADKNLGGHVIDVIVPVYAGLDETRRCIESVLVARQVTDFELIIVDDCGPEPELRDWLRELAQRAGVHVLVNEANRGFVASVNRGMALHAGRDVVLLNSDTRVTGDWLDRLARCAYGEPDIGTVTPFSNNATICSFPFSPEANPVPPDVSWADVDVCLKAANAGRSVDIPTAVGFCMYIRRDCLEQVGLFDAEAFGRGYGEENDFSLRASRAGWRNVLCADTAVFHQGAVSFGTDRYALMKAGGAALLARYPDYDARIQAHLFADPAAELRRAGQIRLARWRREQALGSVARPGPVLHVLHDLGGGILQWCRDYFAADAPGANLLLKPWSRSPAFGEGLALFDSPDAPNPLWIRHFAEPIAATVDSHMEYHAALDELTREYSLGAVLVSSLIGHSLDVLQTGLPTVVVQHDFYPVCPAINAYFDAVCERCDQSRLSECSTQNPEFNPFLDFPAERRGRVKERFVELAKTGALSLVVPTDGVARRLFCLAPALIDAAIVSIPHGRLRHYVPLKRPAGRPGRLRIVVLGMLANSKGLALLQATIDEMLGFADLHLIGAGEVGELFRDRPGVQVLDRYHADELPELLAAIDPDIGLLMSICHETFSYTLGELFSFGIPPVATRVGSFVERIRDGVNGFLFAPQADAMLQCLRTLDADRVALQRVRAGLANFQARSAFSMVADYRELLGRTAPELAGSVERHPCDAPLPVNAPEITLTMAAELSRAWKDRKSLNLRLQMKDGRIDSLQARLRAQALECAREQQLRQEMEACLRQREADLFAMQTSTSWALSRPVRWLGGGLRAIRQKISPAASPAPPPVPARVDVAPDWRQATWQEYQAKMTTDWREQLAARVRAMQITPLISVLVPVYNTPEPMLRAMLNSVRAQIYPFWELCLVDDGSSERRIAGLLDEFARVDERIRVQQGGANRGVSNASNRALAMARGEFVVLLDHDDMLEPQALLRVAECVANDDPDMFYSDEVLQDADGETVQHFVFRPAFSLAYLRSHPFIVHLVGFRTALLRQLGGFDESLSISQDYDLILRVCERARTIVHIPEILYRWRIHSTSAGHARMNDVMTVSKAALGRHLQRCGEVAAVQDGVSFNFFDIRYSLQAGLRVAIVIPTKNRADLVRTCIESIRRTGGELAYDIVLVDHESDEPEALAYFAGLGETVTVLHHAGPFNFAALNNRAVGHLGASYSHYLFCNNDIEALEPGWLQRMLELGQGHDVGIVGAKLYYPDGKTIQHAGVAMACCGVAENLGRFRVTTTDPLDLGYMGSLVATREVLAVTAACMLIRREAFEAVAGFDEALAVGYGDVDLCLRVRERGYRVLFCPAAALLHHESASRGPSDGASHPEDTARFVARWDKYFVEGDPYFSPNLAKESPNWQIAQPIPLVLDIRRRVWKAVSA